MNGHTPTPSSTTSGFLSGGGEMAELIVATDWSGHAAGTDRVLAAEPAHHRQPVPGLELPDQHHLGSRAQCQIYNDGYRVVCGEAHPKALGESYTGTWASAWPVIGAPFETARAGETSFLENQRMFLFRNGYLEETFFTFSLSPIRDESGEIGGLFHPVTETTASMLAERRTRLLRDLNARLARPETTRQVFVRCRGDPSLRPSTCRSCCSTSWRRRTALYRLAGSASACRLGASRPPPQAMSRTLPSPWPLRPWPGASR
jgi:hypothetical protein